MCDLFDRAAEVLRESPLRKHSIVELPARGKLLVTGDLHDNPIHLQKMLKLARLDESPDHHVILHEMIHGEMLVNGLDLSHRMLARVAELVSRYPQQVHPLLANHELSQMTGKGVSKGAGNSVELFNDGLEYVFGDDAGTVADAITRFIRAFPVALRTDQFMCSHSLPAPHMMKHFDVNMIKRELAAEDYASPFGSAHLMVWGRGHAAEQIEQLAAAWNIEFFCIGHEKVEMGIELKTPRLLAINSDHSRAMAIWVDLSCAAIPEDLVRNAASLTQIA